MSTLCAYTELTVLATDAVSTTFEVKFRDTASGVPFTPNLIFLFWTGPATHANSVARGNMQQGRGLVVSPTSRGYASYTALDNVGSQVSQRAENNNACVGLISAGATDGLLDISAISQGLVTFIVDEQFGQDMAISMLGLGGDLDASIVEYLAADDGCVTDPIDVTGFGHDPVCGIGITAEDAAFGVGSSLGRLSMGVFRSVSQQGAWGAGSDNAGGTSLAGRYNRFGDIALVRTRPTDSVAFRNSFNSLITDGFRFNCLEDDQDLFVMAGMIGGSYHIEEFVTRTTLGTITLTPGFRVAGGIIMSHNTAESVDTDTGAFDSSASIGVFSGIQSRRQGVQYAFDLDNVGTTRTIIGKRNGAVYMRSDEAASPVIEGSIRVQSIDATTVTLDQTVADADAAHCIALLFGSRQTRKVLTARGLRQIY